MAKAKPKMKTETKTKTQSTVVSPFSSCASGHDLTKENAYIYDGAGRRSCRECALLAKDGKKAKRSTRTRGSFA